MALAWGIVGYGWVARDHFAPGARAAGHRIAAVCDPSPAARAAAEAEGVRGYADLSELLADPEMEAVYVATPNHLHRGPVEACAAAGLPLLVEKPTAATLADAEAMAGAVRRADVVAGTAFDQRWHPAHCRAAKLIAEGALGRIAAVRIVYACWLGPDWVCPWQAPGADNWRADPARAGGGAVMDLAPHALDLVERLLGEPVVALQAMLHRRIHAYAVDDGGLLAGRTASGVLVSIHVAYNTPEALPRRRLEVVGERAQLTALNTMGQDGGGRLLLTDGATGAETAVAFAAASPFAEQCRAFEGAVRARDRRTFSLERDLQVMRLLDGVYAEDRAALTAHGAAA